MRMMLKVNIPTVEGNAGIVDGSLPATFEKILAELKPEAAYFTDEDGMRTGLLFFDMKDTSEIPKIAEPWMLAFNAKISFRPVMSREDLKAAMPGIQAAVVSFWGKKK